MWYMYAACSADDIFWPFIPPLGKVGDTVPKMITPALIEKNSKTYRVGQKRAQFVLNNEHLNFVKY